MNKGFRKSLHLWKGDLASEKLYNGAKTLAEHIGCMKSLVLSTPSNINISSKFPIQDCTILKPQDGWRAPRMFRIYDTEGDEIPSVHWNRNANFTHLQEELRHSLRFMGMSNLRAL